MPNTIQPGNTEPYTFIDMSGSLSIGREDVSQYAVDPELGRDIDVTILVKSDNQRERDNDLRESGKYGIGSRPENAIVSKSKHRQTYFGGYIVQASLAEDSLMSGSVHSQEAVQPTGIDIKPNGETVYACGNRLLLSEDGRLDHVTRILEDPMFARLHSAAFSEDGERVLTASSSLDMLYEVRLDDGTVTWSMDLWNETPCNINTRNQSFYRSAELAPAGSLYNPPSSELEDNEQLWGASCVVDDPEAYRWIGLSTPVIPVFVNAIDYESDRHLMATSFSRGEAWLIDRDQRRVDVIARGLGRPHGLHVDSSTGQYFTSDTVKEEALFIDKSLEHSTTYDLSHLGARKPGLEKFRWLQYTCELEPDVYCAVMTSRQKLTLFNPAQRVMRDIDIDPDWSIQLVRSQPAAL